MTLDELSRDQDDDPADVPGEHWQPASRTTLDVSACRREHKTYWQVTLYRAVRAGGYPHKRRESNFSTLTCTAPGCGRQWRTDAAYVDKLMRGRTLSS